MRKMATKPLPSNAIISTNVGHRGQRRHNGGGSILIANTDLGDSYQHGDDFDDYGIEDNYDNVHATQTESV